MRTFYCFFLILLFTISGWSQTFTELNFNIPALSFSNVEWVDSDNDNDLDLFLAGGNANVFTFHIYLFENVANDLSNKVLEVPMSYQNKYSIVDYDRDNDVDIIVLNYTSLLIYENLGNNQFQQKNVFLNNASDKYMLWDDYNNDGKVDCIVGNELFRNEGNDQFTSIYNFVSLNSGQYIFSDLNNDGLKDVVFTGNYEDQDRRIYTYINNGFGFNSSAPAIEGIDFGNLISYDIDSDGFQDIIVNGYQDNTSGVVVPKISIYKNLDGLGNFQSVQPEIPGTAEGSLNIIDFNNDGIMDIFISGKDSTNQNISHLYQNNSENFNLVKTFPGTYVSNSTWGDFDNDNDLDLIITRIEGDTLAKIYKNEISTPNTLPSSPGELNSNIVGSSVLLSWNAANDNETPTPSISYNLRIGTSPGASDILSALSEVNIGERHIVEIGNVFLNKSITIRNLLNGIYYWSVQSIDNQMAGSSFSDEQTFVVDSSNTHGFLELGSQIVGINNGKARWIDYDNDGDYDIVLTGLNYHSITGNRVAKIYKNTNSVFTEINTNFTPLGFSSLDFGDYNGDKKVDIMVAGVDSNFNNRLFICRNEGDDNFTEININVGGTINGDIKFGDYDNDGDLDFALSGSVVMNSEYRVEIWRNDGSDVFMHTSVVLPYSVNGSVEWGDYDNDEDLDLAINCGGEHSYKIFKNDGNEQFNDLGPEFYNNQGGPIKWCDYDSDGDLDLLAGNIFYKNTNSNFIQSITLPTDNFIIWSTAIGDIDTDGDPDIIVNGVTNGTGMPVVALYTNENDNQFIFTPLNISKTWLGNIELADFNTDGDVDILISGQSDSNPMITKVFENLGYAPNQKPLSPTSKISFIENGLVNLSWNRGRDNETDSLGLNYNLLIEQIENGNEVVPSHSNNNGSRYLPSAGNMHQNLSWHFDAKESGTYSWAVQSIDNSYAGSLFTETSTFYLHCKPVFSIDTIHLGEIKLGEQKAQSFNVQNEGNIKLRIKNIIPTLNWIDINPANAIIYMDSTEYFNITFSAWEIGQFSGLLEIAHNGFNKTDTLFFDATVIDSATSVVGDKDLPKEFALSQNYPNPFNPSTCIQYSISSRQFVMLKVYDVIGNEVAILVSEEKPAGNYEVSFDASKLSSGVYYYQLRSGEFIQTKKMIYLK